uniref:Neuropeptide F n=1 Tax=Trichobilharzia regenti TaxID=157069 RepID=A0AA85KLZ4_TRIRE|nr:unnamed protein product [Trichobilharzia regenti]
MFCHVSSHFSSKWNVKSMNYMSVMLILLIKAIVLQSNSPVINANEGVNNLSSPEEQQRVQNLAKLMTLFYSSDAFNKYMENLDAYYMLRGRPRFGKRSPYTIDDNDAVIRNHLLNNHRRQKLLRKYLPHNGDNEFDDGLTRK